MFFRIKIYHIYIKYSDRQASAYSIDPDHRPQNGTSVQGLYCLPFHLQFLDTFTGNQWTFTFLFQVPHYSGGLCFPLRIVIHLSTCLSVPQCFVSINLNDF